jgi:hypothetical protein
LLQRLHQQLLLRLVLKQDAWQLQRLLVKAAGEHLALQLLQQH